MKTLKNGMPILELTEGNSKLTANEKSKFLIWDIPAVITCPQRTPMCEKLCYARKAERMYKQTLPFRERNFEDSKQADFILNMINTIEYYINKPSYKNKDIYIRIHSSGDFYNYDYFAKWAKIAWYFIDDKRIKFGTYTKSFYIVSSFTNDFTIPDNMVIRWSLWADTPTDIATWIIENKLPFFTALSKEDIEADKMCYHCIGDCGKCKACYNKNVIKIACKIH